MKELAQVHSPQLEKYIHRTQFQIETTKHSYCRTRSFLRSFLGKSTLTATIKMQADATPRFHKTRPVPFAVKDAISQKLDRLEQEGIIHYSCHSQQMGCLHHTCHKERRKIQSAICSDYKVSVNQALVQEEYPLSAPEELFSTLVEGKFFSKLDLFRAYLQLPVEESSKPFLTVNTHKGL